MATHGELEIRRDQALTVTQDDALVLRKRYEDREMLETLKQTVCRGATDAQFKMFVEVCRSTGLNPFLKEIWYVPSVGVMAGRDGYLRVANEHPMFDGMETRVERDEKGIPIKATCSVWRKDRSHPITCEAFYDEYKKTGNVWQTYKSAMIGKVAEVLALKRSFSINGVVTEEEIGPQEPRGSKEAAAEVAQKKIAALESGASRREVEDLTVDAEHTEPPTELERKLAQSISDANVKRDVKAGSDSVDFKKMMDGFKTIKSELASIGQEDHYYRILSAHGFEHANEIRPLSMARTIYKEMAIELKDLKNIKDAEVSA